MQPAIMNLAQSSTFATPAFFRPASDARSAFNESIVETAALEWFGELGYAVGHGPYLAPGEHAGGTLIPALSLGERESCGEVVLVGSLRETIRRYRIVHIETRLNP